MSNSSSGSSFRSRPHSGDSGSTAPRWNEITAVFGGRFDPPHLGHREAVRGLFVNPGIKQVLILPSASPPHKSTLASADHRAQMVELNFKSTPMDSFPGKVQIDLRELERGKRNPHRPSYSFDTLLELRQTEPHLAFVIGTDQAEYLHTWHRFPEILGLCHWIVLERKPDGAARVQKALYQYSESGLIKPFRGTNQGLLWEVQKRSIGGSSSNLNTAPTFIISVSTEAPAVSSTEIRESISRTGHPPQGGPGLLPDVIGYLKQERLYGI